MNFLNIAPPAHEKCLSLFRIMNIEYKGTVKAS